MLISLRMTGTKFVLCPDEQKLLVGNKAEVRSEEFMFNECHAPYHGNKIIHALV